MKLSQIEKQFIKEELVERLRREPEIRKVVIFGSFPTSSEPNDLDVAIFQDSDQFYLPLALKYRRLLRPLAGRIPLDIIPVRPTAAQGSFFDDIKRGEVVYEC